MKYRNITEGIFHARPNRFIAEVTADGERIRVHVKNTGRCRELLIPGCRVYLEKSDNPERKTPYDLVAVETPWGIINMDSQIPNAAAYEWLSAQFPDAVIRREVKRGNSRVDLTVERDGRLTWVEVKGVTLAADGIAMFPDAPTERGVKHIRELADGAGNGEDAWILFVIQREDCRLFEPNWETHAELGDALNDAQAAGVKIIAMDCTVTPDEMTIRREIPVNLTKK